MDISKGRHNKNENILRNIIQKISILDCLTLSNSSMQHIPLSASINAPASTQNSPKSEISSITGISVNLKKLIDFMNLQFHD